MPNYKLPTFLNRRRRLWECVGVICCVLAVGLFSAGPAGAIIGGQVDGGGHPYAGAIDGSQAPLGGVASGVLISPTVFLTAGHFTSLLEHRGVTTARVTFDSVVNGASTWHVGTIHTDPAFDPQRANDTEDLGVVVFDTPITGITPARLPSADLLDQLAPQGLHGAAFDAVGYGVTSFVGGGDGVPPHPDRATFGTRKVAELSYMSLTSAWLRLLPQDGSPCSNDSGGPALFAGTDLVAGTVTVGFGHCDHSPQWFQRVDTPSARAFLGSYVTLP